MNELMTNLGETLLAGNMEQIKRLTEEALNTGATPQDILEQGLRPAMEALGNRFSRGEAFLPELLVAAETMKASMEILQPAIVRDGVAPKATMLLGTVEGDIHDIGKNLVASMLGANGFQVVDLGADVKLDLFISKAQEENADFICVSALLTTTMMQQRTLVAKLRDQGLIDRFKVMVGGAPANRQWAEDIGAHGYAENAMAAVQAVKKLSVSR